MQRRALGRGARVARDQVQLLHGHVQLVAAGVFEHHELAVLAGHLHDLQADVAAHAVFLVDHRRARPEGGEVAQDGLRIGGGAAPAAFLARALAEELRFAEHRDRRRDDVEPAISGATDMRESARCCRRIRASPRPPAGLSPCARSISSSTSRRPAESAASSTRPGYVSRKSSSGASGRSARRSMRHSCGAAVGKL